MTILQTMGAILGLGAYFWLVVWGSLRLKAWAGDRFPGLGFVAYWLWGFFWLIAVPALLCEEFAR